jgi:hypothetical protein
MSAIPEAQTGSEALSNISKTDPSLLHQITTQQKEIQDLLAERRETAARLKALEVCVHSGQVLSSMAFC